MPVPCRGLLLVYTELGPAIRPSTYEAWHDTEHVWPLLNLPGPLFLSATRYQAADPYKPSHLALYDLASTSAVHDPAYTALIEPGTDTDSDTSMMDGRGSVGGRRVGGRGPGVPDEVERMERRVYEPLADKSRAQEYASGSGEGGNDEDEYPLVEPGTYLTVTEVELKKHAEGEFNRWFDEEHIPLLTRVPGWVRSRRFALKEVLHEETGDTSDTDTERARKVVVAGACGGRGREVREERPPKYLALHEYTSVDAFRSKEFKRATSTPWRAQVLREESVLKYNMRVFRNVRNWGRFEV